MSDTKNHNIVAKIIYFTIAVINIIVAIPLLVATLSKYIDPTQFALPSLLSLAFVELFIVNVFFVVLWLFTSKRVCCLISLITILIAMRPLMLTFNFKSNQTTSFETDNRLKILTYNTLRTGKRLKPEKNEVIKYIQQSNADIVFMQEYEESKNIPHIKKADIIKALKDYTYHQTQFRISNKGRDFGVAIYSKYPLFNKHNIEFESAYNGAFYCDAAVGNDTIRLICAHLESNQITGIELDEPMEGAKSQNAQQVSTGAKVIINKLISAYKIRSIQAKEIAKIVNNSPYKIILCGDFNDVPQGYCYNTIANKLVDSFSEAGPHGFGNTFKRKWLHVRIDYILHSKEMKACNFHIDKNEGSDHYPVYCTIGW